MIEREQKPFRVIADLSAASSGINLSVVKNLNLLPNIKTTAYTYRTSVGKVEKGLGTVEVSPRIDPIVVKTDMVVIEYKKVNSRLHELTCHGPITCSHALNIQ